MLQVPILRPQVFYRLWSGDAALPGGVQCWRLQGSNGSAWRSRQQTAGRSPPSSTTQLCGSPAPRGTCCGPICNQELVLINTFFCRGIKWTAELAELRIRPALNHSPGGRLGWPLSRGALAPSGVRYGVVFIDGWLSLSMSARACTKPLELHRFLFWNSVKVCCCTHCCRASSIFLWPWWHMAGVVQVSGRW